jgi:hypothetical protein
VGARDLDRVDGSGPPISDHVTVCRALAPSYRSESVQRPAAGSSALSLVVGAYRAASPHTGGP